MIHARPIGCRVVVLEDSDEDFDSVRQAAQRLGLQGEVCRATTGDECLKLLRGDGAAPIRAAVVLLDLNTPGLDGRDALGEIRSDALLSSVPVVVLTTSANPREINACYARGANACHVKCVRYEEHVDLLVDMLAYWTRRVTLPDATRRPA